MEVKRLFMSAKIVKWGLWQIGRKEWLIDTQYKRPYSFTTRKAAEQELKSRYKKGDRTDPFAGYFRNCVIPKKIN